MIVGLCGSFALVPALSLVNSASGATRQPVQPAPHPAPQPAPQLGDAAGGSPSPSSDVVAALLLANAPLWTTSRVGNARSRATFPPLAVATTVPTTVPAAAPPQPVVAALPATAVPPAAPAPTSVPVPTRLSQTLTRGKNGVASWLDTIPAGTCANNDAPMGSTIKVTNASGISVTCRVVSTGPFVAGRVVDLARSTFAQLGPVSQGLVGVSVSW